MHLIEGLTQGGMPQGAWFCPTNWVGGRNLHDLTMHGTEWQRPRKKTNEALAQSLEVRPTKKLVLLKARSVPASVHIARRSKSTQLLRRKAPCKCRPRLIRITQAIGRCDNRLCWIAPRCNCREGQKKILYRQRVRPRTNACGEGKIIRLWRCGGTWVAAMCACIWGG